MPGLFLSLVCGLGVIPQHLAAQSEYRNTDPGRPVRTEDAYAVDRYTLDLHVAPVTAAWRAGGPVVWSLNPGIAYGLVPRTQVNLGVPLESRGGDVGAGGIDISALYTFNAETAGWPALGLRGGVVLPVGALAPSRTYTSLKGIATRSFSQARLHVNTEYTFGALPDGPDRATVTDLRRWRIGGAVDRTFVLQSLLVTGEVVADQPIDERGPVAWTVAGGVRYQLTPSYGLEAGIGTTLAARGRPLFVTFGLSRSRPSASLIPGFGRWW